MTTPSTLTGRRLLDRVLTPVVPDPDGRISVIEAVRLDAREEMAAMIVAIENEATAACHDARGEPFFDSMVCGVAVCNWSGPVAEFPLHPHREW